MGSRRRFFGSAMRLGLLAWIAGLGGLAWRRRARAADDSRTFRACLDTLIPDEPDAPGAIHLGIAERVTASMGDADMIAEFCGWLDARAQTAGGRPFADLPAEERDAILRAADSAAPESLAQRAFRRTRHEAYAHYYADARAWPGIGYRGPPQPDGFPDYARPPEGG